MNKSSLALPLTSRRFAIAPLLLAAVFALAARPTAAQEPRRAELLVYAAASLTNALDELTAGWQQQSGVSVKTSYAASSVLARQIEAGGKADVFISADQEWMDYLQSRGLIRQATRRDLAGNRLVLIAPNESHVELQITPGFDLAGALGNGRLSTADPDTVPAGRYARSALLSLGVWNEMQHRLVRADNVRSALMYVSRGEAPLGIVYATDARADPRVRVVDVFPENTHAPITYPAAATRAAGPGTIGFLNYLASAAAADTWRRFGFEGTRK